MSYCIEKTHSLFQVKNDLKQILLEDENVILDTQKNCIELAVRPYRHSLVSKFIRMSYPIVSSKDGNIVFQGQMCRFFLRKDEALDATASAFELGKNFKINNFDEKKKAISTREILVSEGRVGILDLDNTSMYVKCSILPGRIEIELALNSKFEQSLSTTVDILEGEWLSISSVFEDLSNKSKSMSASDGLKIEKKDGEKKVNFSISVKK